MAAGTTLNADLQTPQESRESAATAWSWSLLCTKWYKFITVEPTMFLYMFAFMITGVVEQDFFLQKACRVNLKLDAEICRNIKSVENADYKQQVQIAMANFLQWESICAHVFPIFLALFLGSFSDKFGRKLPLLIGLIGKFYYSTMIVVNDQMTNWPVEYVLYTATLPTALTGSDLAIFASCFAYLSDVTTVSNRTWRITLLDVVYLSTMPLGIALGSYLFSGPLLNSYSYMFIINASLLFLAILYTLTLKWNTTDKQRSPCEVSVWQLLREFFDKKHVIDSYNVLTKRRPNHGRTLIIIVLIAMGLYTFQRDEGNYTYQYTIFAFNWDLVLYSNFKTVKSSVYVLGVLLAVPLLNKCLGLRDTTTILVGNISHSAARFFYYFATSGELFYAGAIACCVGPVVAPMLRSIMSKAVPVSERGKVFALLAVCDNAVPFISSVCYSQIYQATLRGGTGGNGIFLLTIATQVGVFLLTLIIKAVFERKLTTDKITDSISDKTDIQKNESQKT